MRITPALFALPLVGCLYDEGLLIENLHGTVSVPVSVAQREIVDPNATDGSTILLDDRRLLGPVYLGLYPSVEAAGVIERYPHPEVGPQYLEGIPGDTYPYGATTIGDLRFGCFEFLTCKLTSGRFVDYDDLISWFASIGQPIVDSIGVEVTEAEYFQQQCFDLLDVTSDKEVRITATEDRNGDDKIDEQDLDFVLDADGAFYTAEFTFWQQEFFWDQEQENCEPGRDCTGFSLWGWIDSPSLQEYKYSTCLPASGFRFEEYSTELFSGQPYIDLLNFPSTYIAGGDWVATEPFVWQDIYDEPDLVLDFAVE